MAGYLDSMKHLSGYTGWVSDSHLFIASAAAAFTWSGFVQLGAVSDPVIIALTGFATLSTYNIQTLLRRFAPHRLDTFLSWNFHLFFALIGMAGVTGCLMIAPPKLILWLIFPGLLSVLYATPIFSFRGLKIALRGVPWLKIWLILTVWVWVTAVIPLVFSSHTNLPDAGLFTIQRGLLILSLLIPFDIRDLDTDYDFQRTLPQMIGIRKSTWIALAAVTGYVVISILRYGTGTIDLPVATALILSGLYASVFIARTGPSRPGYYFTVFIDSVLLIQPLLIWLLVTASQT